MSERGADSRRRRLAVAGGRGEQNAHTDTNVWVRLMFCIHYNVPESFEDYTADALRRGLVVFPVTVVVALVEYFHLEAC